MCDKAINEYPYPINLIPDRFKTEDMCDKAVEETWFINFEYVPDRFKSQESC